MKRLKPRKCIVCEKVLPYYDRKKLVHNSCLNKIKRYKFNMDLLLERIQLDYNSYLEPRNEEAIKALRKYWDWLLNLQNTCYIDIKYKRKPKQDS